MNNTNPQVFSRPAINQPSKQEGNSPAFHFFLYLVSFLSLWFVSIGNGTILYQLIDKFFPDPAKAFYGAEIQQSAIKFGVASLLVAAPIYFVFSFLITRYLKEGKIPEDSKVRKWTTYIILFIAAAIIIGNSINLIFNLLGGELVARFILKSLVIFFIAGLVFGYYFWDMRKKELLGKSYLGNKIAFGLAVTMIAATLVSAFSMIDSPRTTRNKKLDKETISISQNYQFAIGNYYSQKGVLPQDLTELKEGNYYPLRPDVAVSYRKTGELTYELCATFQTSDLSEKSYGGYGQEWKHDEGNVCFQKSVTPRNP